MKAPTLVALPIPWPTAVATIELNSDLAKLSLEMKGIKRLALLIWLAEFSEEEARAILGGQGKNYRHNLWRSKEWLQSKLGIAAA